MLPNKAHCARAMLNAEIWKARQEMANFGRKSIWMGVVIFNDIFIQKCLTNNSEN